MDKLFQTFIPLLTHIIYLSIFSGIITTSRNITVWPEYPYTTRTIVVRVSNMDNTCAYTAASCTMTMNVYFTNWVYILKHIYYSVIKQNISTPLLFGNVFKKNAFTVLHPNHQNNVVRYENNLAIDNIMINVVI
jgi:hypothetical protein